MGISTGFSDLDDRLEGLCPSDLILIAARPFMGKTTFATDIARHALIEQKRSVLFLSLEAPKWHILTRLFSEVQLNSELLSGERGSKLNIEIIAEPGISISDIFDKCRWYKRDNEVELIIIDYLELITSDKKFESRLQEIYEVFRSLKALAVELDVPVVVTSQLGRTLEQRPDKRPVLSDLAECVVQNADTILFIYRDEYYNEDTEEPGVAEINIAKQKSGIVGTVKLAWLPKLLKYYRNSNDEYYADDVKNLYTFADLDSSDL